MVADESLPADPSPRHPGRGRVRGGHTPCLSRTAEWSRRYFSPTRRSRCGRRAQHRPAPDRV